MSLTPSSSYIPGHRRTWDKTEFEIKAQERLAAEKEAFDIKRGIIKPPKFPKVQRELLKPREFKVHLTIKLIIIKSSWTWNQKLVNKLLLIKQLLQLRVVDTTAIFVIV